MKQIAIGVVAGSIVAGAGLGAGGQAIDLSRSRLVDLTHAYNAQTIYWPTATTRFRLEKLAHGPTPGGYFYSSYSLSTPEHGGTHLDAPVHFSERGRSADQVPLAQLIAPAVVIDVSPQAAANPDYRLSADDVLAFERQHGRIAAGTIVLLRTGWSRRWPDVKSVPRRRYARGLFEASLPGLRGGWGAPPRGGAPCRHPRRRHRIPRLRPLHRLHCPPPRGGDSRSPAWRT